MTLTIFETFIESYKDIIGEFITIDLEKIKENWKSNKKFDEEKVMEVLKKIYDKKVLVKEYGEIESITLINECYISKQIRVHSKIRKMFKPDKEKISNTEFNEKLNKLNLNKNFIYNLDKIKLPLMNKLALSILFKYNYESEFDLNISEMQKQFNKHIFIKNNELRKIVFDLYNEEISMEGRDSFFNFIFTPIIIQRKNNINENRMLQLKIHEYLYNVDVSN